jgi:hypothetical protein
VLQGHFLTTRQYRNGLVNPDLVPRIRTHHTKTWEHRNLGCPGQQQGPKRQHRWGAKKWHWDITAMARGTVHLHGYHIASPQCHEQLDKYRAPIIGHKAQISRLHSLPQEALDGWVLLWSHEHMEASAICAQEPTGKFPVPQMRCRRDEPPGVLQHRLQVWKTLYPGHVGLLL